MPDIITHSQLGASALALLAPACRASIRREIFDHATAGPDIWFSYRFWNPKAQEQKPRRGDEMQHRHTGAFLRALANEAVRSDAREELFSYLAGFLCHYCLDRAAHPYIIYRSGEYDGSEATRPNRGNHMRLEHALDLWTLRKWGLRMGQFPIVRKIIYLRKLPKAMQPGLDAAYKRVYGWTHAWRDLNRAIRDQRLFYRLAQDPLGLLDAVLQRMDRGTARRDLTALSYHGKEQHGIDVANEAHLSWRHPMDAALVYSDSFADICQNAAQDACTMISAAWAFIWEGIPPGDAFGNASYETGFDWRDSRNAHKPACDPLPLQKHGRRKG